MHIPSAACTTWKRGGGGVEGHEQRIQDSHIPPSHRHMVIVTTLSSLFDLLHCSTHQMRPNVSWPAVEERGGGGGLRAMNNGY